MMASERMGVMQPLLQPSVAESLSAIWAALHRDAEMTIAETEVHYLRAMAVTIDDDVTSALLLRKLQLAQILHADALPPKTVGMNSFLEYAYDGRARFFCQIVHPSAALPNYALPVTSSLGAGLVGLREGQTILWPDERGTLCDLSVLRVENCSGLAEWLDCAAASGARA